MTSKANIEALRESLATALLNLSIGAYHTLNLDALRCGMDDDERDVRGWATRFLAEHKESGE